MKGGWRVRSGQEVRLKGEHLGEDGKDEPEVLSPRVCLLCVENSLLDVEAALPQIWVHFIKLSPPRLAPQPRAVECTNSLGEWLMPKWGSRVLIPWAGGEMLILRARRGWSGECAPTRIIGTNALDRSCFVFYDSRGGVGANG